jgi:hypothetical protein
MHILCCRAIGWLTPGSRCRALDSIKAGKRLSEAAYSLKGLVAGRQRSVYGIFNVTKRDSMPSELKAREESANVVLKGGSNGGDEGKENSKPSPEL